MKHQGVRIHSPDKCEGRNCCFHNPSDHHMRDWVLNLRIDRGYPVLTERICEHGVGHPDPDSLAWISTLEDEWKYIAIHGCDGCCSPPREEPPPPTMTPEDAAWHWSLSGINPTADEEAA